MRRSKFMRLGAGLLPVLLGLSIISTVILSRKARKQSPKTQLSILMIKIADTAKTVKKAYLNGLIEDQEFEKAKKHLETASRRYNELLRNYRKFGTFASTEREEILALLLAAIKTVKEAKKDG